MKNSHFQEVISLSANICDLDLPANSCLYHSALLYATLRDNTDINPRFIVGSVKILDKYVFKLDTKISFNFEKNFSIQWDGHAWVEIDNLIIDLSLFKSIKHLNSDNIFHKHIYKYFNGIPNFLIISKEKLEQYKISYIAHNELSDNDATILINSIDYLK
jgi:hypothetical protein